MHKLLFILFLFAFGNSVAQQLSSFEKSNGTQTATYFEAIDWYKKLAQHSKEIVVKEMGTTDAGYPLQLVLLSTDKKFDPAIWRRQNKVIILINNGIHAGEPDGIDASMLLARDIITKKLLLSVSVPVIKNDEAIYALDIGFLPDQFAKIIAAQNISPGARAESLGLDEYVRLAGPWAIYRREMKLT